MGHAERRLNSRDLSDIVADRRTGRLCIPLDKVRDLAAILQRELTTMYRTMSHAAPSTSHDSYCMLITDY